MTVMERLIPTAAKNHLRRAAKVVERIGVENERHAAKVAELQAARRLEWLKANRAGARYDDIVLIAGVSDGLVCREIALARDEVGGELAERPRR